MRRYLIGFLALLIGGATFFAYPSQAGAPTASSYSVKIIVGQGHGSGTHIGSGYIVTAAHVVDTARSVVIKTDNGRKRYAQVLWVNKDYDLALLRTGPHGIAAANLSCRALHVGDAIRADGNPLNIEFVSSSGRISGDARPTERHKSAYITDMTTVMGMSGGGVFDKAGDLVGVTSAVAVAPLKVGTGYVPSLTGFGMAVPSFEVCALMGRGE